jgi:hypothetical protein
LGTAGNSADLEATRQEEQITERFATIERFKRLKELKEQKNAFREEIACKTDSGSTPKQGRDCYNSTSSFSNSPNIKLTNLPIFTPLYSFRKRDKWIRDLERAFEGARKKYKRDFKKVYKALD